LARRCAAAIYTIGGLLVEADRIVVGQHLAALDAMRFEPNGLREQSVRDGVMPIRQIWIGELITRVLTHFAPGFRFSRARAALPINCELY
jgi:hypothetical protein